MDQVERTLLAGLPEVARTIGSPGWNSLWQNAVGCAMGRDGWTATHVDQRAAATIRAELTR